MFCIEWGPNNKGELTLSIQRVGIVDYGAGNIANVVRAFSAVSVDVGIVTSRGQAGSFSHLVLPGVGAFSYGMRALTSQNMDQAILDALAAGKSVLGICLGMQLFAEHGLENGYTAGIGYLDGYVGPIRDHFDDEAKIRIPHTGWAVVEYRRSSMVSVKLGGALAIPSAAYFNHSYVFNAGSEELVTATTTISGRKFAAIVQRETLVATQFHPEKSGEEGLRFIRSWLELT